MPAFAARVWLKLGKLFRNREFLCGFDLQSTGKWLVLHAVLFSP